MGPEVGALAAGFTAGLLHVVAGPDHIAALAPLAVRNRAQSVRTGAIWGSGHGTGVVILGSTGIGAKQFVDIHWISDRSEIIVGFMLLGIGFWALRQTLRLHSLGFGSRRVHSHDDEENAPDPNEKNIRIQEDVKLQHSAAFGVGVLHGAAGTGHLFGVLPSLALPPLQAIVYLVSYLIAAVMAMAGVGFILGSVGEYGGPRAILYMMGVSSLGAILVGLVWIIA